VFFSVLDLKSGDVNKLIRLSVQEITECKYLELSLSDYYEIKNVCNIYWETWLPFAVYIQCMEILQPCAV
jgi:hypothetical protein